MGIIAGTTQRYRLAGKCPCFHPRGQRKQYKETTLPRSHALGRRTSFLAANHHKKQCERVLLLNSLVWSPTGKPLVPINHTTYAPGRRSAPAFAKPATAGVGRSVRRRQGFGGSSAGERNPPKLGRIVGVSSPVQSYAILHGQGRGFLRRWMKGRPVDSGLLVRPVFSRTVGNDHRAR